MNIGLSSSLRRAARTKQEKITIPFALKYTDDDGSDLKAVVTTDESKNNFEFKLEAKNDVSSKPSSRDRN